MELVGGTVVANRFRLVRELGHGGMGSVWLAQDTSLDTPCAIKFIHGQAAEDQSMRARFEREAKSAAQLRSPNVVQILDHGVSDGFPYIAMELLDGEDLDQRLRRVGRLSPNETVFIISQVGKALSKAAAVSLVHRDLKPANIFLVRDEDRDIPKVLDFGVAKSTVPELADSSTKTGALMGTPFYMSPEQTRGTKAIDHRSDLWALGVITFQCVTGRLPFLSDSLGDLLFKIATDPLPVPSQVAPDIAPGFDAWWARAAQRDPNLRFQTAKEFVDALSQAFGLATSGGIAASGSTAGAYHGPTSPSGSASSSWGGTPQPGHNPSWGPAQTNQGAGAVLGGLPSTGGITASSMAAPASPQRGSTGLIVGVITALAVAGGVVYGMSSRRGAQGTGPVTTNVATAEPPPTTPPITLPPAPTTPVILPTTTASSAQPPPVESASTPKPPTNKPPTAVKKPPGTTTSVPLPPPSNPDGI